MTKRNWANYESDAIGHKALILADETDLTIFIKLITNSEKKRSPGCTWPGIMAGDNYNRVERSFVCNSNYVFLVICT